MCGITGIIGKKNAAPQLVDALKRLEYRGYDSAGVATLENGVLKRVRAEGKLRNLEAALDQNPINGVTGIGHTRWATHGAPTESNAHPHKAGPVAVVHNGIVENFFELKSGLSQSGVVFETDTDTEVVAQLVARELEGGVAPKEAVSKTIRKLEGAFALAIIVEGTDDTIFAARKGSPLAIGHGDDEMFLGSDAIALSPFTGQITYLEEGDWAVLTRSGVEIFDKDDNPVARAVQTSQASAMIFDKGNHRHFMQKEIYEQPEAVGHTLSQFIDFSTLSIKIPSVESLSADDLNRITVSACGTAFYAGLTAKYWLEYFARTLVDIDVASEFRYRNVPVTPGELALFISQSGETADTLASLRYCKEAGQKIATVVNVPESSISREADIHLPTLAGPEIGVASTKAFTCQLTVLAAFTLHAAKVRGQIDAESERKLVQSIIELPRQISETLKLEGQIQTIAKLLAKSRDVLYTGRGVSFPIALEGALKLKELSYIHAEAYAAGEMKHGPIALIDENVPVVVIAPFDAWFEKTMSNAQEIAARGGPLILVTDERGAKEVTISVQEKIVVPSTNSLTSPLLTAIPMQLLAYYAAVFMGTDVDQPRNLAKSVTVE